MHKHSLTAAGWIMGVKPRFMHWRPNSNLGQPLHNAPSALTAAAFGFKVFSSSEENKLEGWSQLNLTFVLIICPHAFETQSMCNVWQNSLCFTSACDQLQILNPTVLLFVTSVSFIPINHFKITYIHTYEEEHGYTTNKMHIKTMPVILWQTSCFIENILLSIMIVYD